MYNVGHDLMVFLKHFLTVGDNFKIESNCWQRLKSVRVFRCLVKSRQCAHSVCFAVVDQKPTRTFRQNEKA